VTDGDPLNLDARLAECISPVGGVISGLEQLGSGYSRGGDTVTLARLGEVGVLRSASSEQRFGGELDGLGCHADPAVSARIAVIEALERYAAAACDERRWLTATAAELGSDALDLTDASRCSADELSAPGCPLEPWDPDRPLRWRRGWSLVDGRDVWVPAVMAQLGVVPRHAGERFWLQTSSGCAAGETEPAALLAACFELIERDGVGIAWLQRLALRRLLPAEPAWGSYWPNCESDTGWGWGDVLSTLRLDQDRERIALFDATSDLGVPTVLAVLPAPPGSGHPTAVGAGCSDSGARAALKALRELTVVRACTWGDGAGDRAHPHVPDEAFAHLDLSAPAPGSERPAGGVNPGPPATRRQGDFIGTVSQRLRRIVGILAREAGDVVAVELTPVELRGTGVRVVRVIVPALIPFLAHVGVRYLDSRRLCEAPRRMGFPVRPPEEVNPWPSPLW